MTSSIGIPRGSVQKTEAKRKLSKIGRVILVGSGKGGVGKSLISCSIAVFLRKRGHKTAILDLDIHGASVPTYLQISPPLRSSNKGLQPKVLKGGLKAMSLGLFTGNSPVPIRGEEKESLIIDLFALTDWGNLDYLVVDLPPGLGDEVLSSFSLFQEKAFLVLVTTPSPNATEVVSRLRQLAGTEAVPVFGIVVNMAYSNHQGRKSYPFGKAKIGELEKALRSHVIGEVPLDSKVSTLSLLKVLGKKGGFSDSIGDLVFKILA